MIFTEKKNLRNVIFQFFVHTEVVYKLHPVIEYIFNTPSHHRVHHARNKRYIDKNYAGMFIMWDRLFGTYIEETETPVYGVVHPIRTFDPVYIQLGSFFSIFKTFHKAPAKLKMHALLAPPGFDVDEKTGAPFMHEIPEKIQGTKFEPTTETRKLVFAVLQYTITVVIFLWRKSAQIQFSLKLVWSFWICLQIYVISRAMENKSPSIVTFISLILTLFVFWFCADFTFLLKLSGTFFTLSLTLLSL